MAVIQIKYTNPFVSAAFIAAHPLRIDLQDGSHVRFGDMVCAARSACHHKSTLWDESNSRGMSLLDCVRITNAAENRMAVA